MLGKSLDSKISIARKIADKDGVPVRHFDFYVRNFEDKVLKTLSADMLATVIKNVWYSR